MENLWIWKIFQKSSCIFIDNVYNQIRLYCFIKKTMSDIIPPYGEQKDGSVIDVYGNILSLDERLEIIEQVEWLPATGMKDDIVNAVRNNSIIIINGETGSGKTTQIGKMLLNQKQQINITQPRRLAAKSNSDRVSQELLAETGDPYFSLWHGVGYRIGWEASSSRISPLSFNTDGLELMRWAYSNMAPNILVLDEIHNFAIPTEILAMLLKRRKNVKTIIMSATLDPNIFQEYYGQISSDIPVINIPGRTYPVTKYFNPGENYVESIATYYTGKKDILWKEDIPWKNILFFVPGKKEIEQAIDLLKKRLGEDAEIFPLHAELPKEQQQALLNKITDKPRIIVCTNVAEESITIPYIHMVMDQATHKVARYNHVGIQELRLENIAQSNCLQRAGRGGRTGPWIYVRANNTPFEELPKYPEAPLEREMLDKYILILLANGTDIIKLHEEESNKGRRLFLHDFNKKLLDISYYRLTQIGAVDGSKNITPLGRDLLKFPLDTYHARMLREAIKRECVEDMIYATAILEKKWFVSKDGKWKRIKMLGGKDSDLFGYTELFKLVTATTLPLGKRELLLWLGIDRDELNDFIDRGGEYKLYELVDLAPLGIKNKKVKEIDELVMDLRELLSDAGVDITSSENMADKKICLASGSLHNVYEYNTKTEDFQNTGHKKGKDTLHFKAGNVTLVEPTNRHLYLGQPFIIGWTWEDASDLNLLTFLTQVDEGHIQDAKFSTRSFIASAQKSVARWEKKKSPARTEEKWGRLHEKKKGGAPSLDIEVVSSSKSEIKKENPSHKGESYERIFQEDDASVNPERVIREYARIIEDFSHAGDSNFFKTQDDARTYYLRYCLPQFLIERNPRIRNYLKGKDENTVFIFKELISRFLLDSEAHRIHPNSIDKTELSFRHDTTILDRFLESEDPFIQAFRKGEEVMFPSEEVELLANIVLDEGSSKNKEVRELQKQYVKLLGSVRWKLNKVDEERMKVEVLKEHLFHVESYSWEYRTITDIYQEIGMMSLSEVKKTMTSLKWVEKKTKVLGKTRHQRENLFKIVETMRNLVRGAENIDTELLFSHKFGEDVSEKYIERYYNTLRLALSKDKRKRQRGINQLEYIIIDVDAQILKLDKEIESLVTETGLLGIPRARIIKENLSVLCKAFFEDAYYEHNVSGKILECTREIVRDQVTEQKGLQKILSQLFYIGKDFRYIKEKGWLFRSIQDYIDISDIIEVYSTTIRQEIQETDDVEKIQLRIQELQAKIEEFQTKKDLIVKNKVAFL